MSDLALLGCHLKLFLKLQLLGVVNQLFLALWCEQLLFLWLARAVQRRGDFLAWALVFDRRFCDGLLLSGCAVLCHRPVQRQLRVLKNGNLIDRPRLA